MIAHQPGHEVRTQHHRGLHGLLVHPGVLGVELRDARPGRKTLLEALEEVHLRERLDVDEEEDLHVPTGRHAAEHLEVERHEVKAGDEVPVRLAVCQRQHVADHRVEQRVVDVAEGPADMDHAHPGPRRREGLVHRRKMEPAAHGGRLLLKRPLLVEDVQQVDCTVVMFLVFLAERLEFGTGAALVGHLAADRVEAGELGATLRLGAFAVAQEGLHLLDPVRVGDVGHAGLEPHPVALGVPVVAPPPHVVVRGVRLQADFDLHAEPAGITERSLVPVGGERLAAVALGPLH
eukprot:CAMPEP_0179289782 /NCGR_PEP_ID=MMETSP0797-20121207/41477_1 /TAXON_ID=47934 /ORGANISM="Dinophysis acuminata, Strain DAEP01" /LENGTH=290 /DNA_ID=CAMNT_0020998793 /DNA_START=24 /DNA_END=893 /DNA_ORIENTATION=+